MKRSNPRIDKLNRLRRKPPVPPSDHTPLAEAIGETERQIRKEIAIMKKCRHPHVVKLLEVIDDKPKSKIYLSQYTLLTQFVAIPSYFVLETGDKPSAVSPLSDLTAPVELPYADRPLLEQSWSISGVGRFVGETSTVTPHCD